MATTDARGMLRQVFFDRQTGLVPEQFWADKHHPLRPRLKQEHEVVETMKPNLVATGAREVRVGDFTFVVRFWLEDGEDMRGNIAVNRDSVELPVQTVSAGSRDFEWFAVVASIEYMVTEHMDDMTLEPKVLQDQQHIGVEMYTGVQGIGACGSSCAR